jgi:hypothetical protein
LSEERVSTILQEFYAKLESQFAKFGGTLQQGDVDVVRERVEDGTGYKLHYYDGCFHRVPSDWRIQRLGVHDMWRQWWIGDTVLQIPPVKYLTIQDIKHIDSKPLSAMEKVRKVGPNKENRRMVTKQLSDIRFLCNYLTRVLLNLGKLESTITMTAVDRMWEIAADEVLGKERDDQKQWNSVVRELRRYKPTTVITTNIVNNITNVLTTNITTNLPTTVNVSTNLATNTITNIDTNVPTELVTDNTTNQSTNVTTNTTTNIGTTLPTNTTTNIGTTLPTEINTNTTTTLPTKIITDITTTLPTQPNNRKKNQ